MGHLVIMRMIGSEQRGLIVCRRFDHRQGLAELFTDRPARRGAARSVDSDPAESATLLPGQGLHRLQEIERVRRGGIGGENLSRAERSAIVGQISGIYDSHDTACQ